MMGSSTETSGVQERLGTHLQPAHLAALVDASKILNSTLDLDHLLELILEVATKQLRADRGTVFLVDKPKAELWARISQGIETRILRLKLGEGIAGKVAQTGQTVRIGDAYRDPRFLPRIDSVSGYRTRSILCRPIRDRKGEIIGVIELMNKSEGTFGVEDEVFLEALTVHMAIALENAKLHTQIVDQERIRTELELAREIQQHLLCSPPERWQKYRFAAKAIPCHEVGGDFYDFLPISGNLMWVVIADVSGKGISSALVMSNLQATLRALLLGVHSFERLLQKLNGMVRELTGGNKFVTLFLALLDGESRKMHYINAGHNPPVLLRSDGRYELLEEGGTVLGLLPGVEYTRAQTRVDPGDVLVLYTDGLVETTSRTGDMLGIEGLVRSLEASPRSGPPDAILGRVLSDAREFAGEEPQGDDLTLVVISPDG